jgi:hypothetical protein
MHVNDSYEEEDVGDSEFSSQLQEHDDQDLEMLERLQEKIQGLDVHLGNQESLLEKLLVGIGFQPSSTSQQAQKRSQEDSEPEDGENGGQLQASNAVEGGNDGISLSNILTRLGNNLGLFRNEAEEEESVSEEATI